MIMKYEHSKKLILIVSIPIANDLFYSFSAKEISNKKIHNYKIFAKS